MIAHFPREKRNGWTQTGVGGVAGERKAENISSKCALRGGGNPRAGVKWGSIGKHREAGAGGRGGGGQAEERDRRTDGPFKSRTGLGYEVRKAKARPRNTPIQHLLGTEAFAEGSSPSFLSYGRYSVSVLIWVFGLILLNVLFPSRRLMTGKRNPSAIRNHKRP